MNSRMIEAGIEPGVHDLVAVDPHYVLHPQTKRRRRVLADKISAQSRRVPDRRQRVITSREQVDLSVRRKGIELVVAMLNPIRPRRIGADM